MYILLNLKFLHRPSWFSRGGLSVRSERYATGDRWQFSSFPIHTGTAKKYKNWQKNVNDRVTFLFTMVEWLYWGKFGTLTDSSTLPVCSDKRTKTLPFRSRKSRLRGLVFVGISSLLRWMPAEDSLARRRKPSWLTVRKRKVTSVTCRPTTPTISVAKSCLTRNVPLKWIFSNSEKQQGITSRIQYSAILAMTRRNLDEFEARSVEQAVPIKSNRVLFWVTYVDYTTFSSLTKEFSWSTDFLIVQ